MIFKAVYFPQCFIQENLFRVCHLLISPLKIISLSHCCHYFFRKEKRYIRPTSSRLNQNWIPAFCPFLETVIKAGLICDASMTLINTFLSVVYHCVKYKCLVKTTVRSPTKSVIVRIRNCKCVRKKTLVIGHVNSIPMLQFFTRISRNTQSNSYMLSLTECVREFRNNALWDTH